MEIKVLKNILSANNQLAEQNRKLLEPGKTLLVNVMSSPYAVPLPTALALKW